jgi:two-component system, chemotaxis family, response regulator Rcp1
MLEPIPTIQKYAAARIPSTPRMEFGHPIQILLVEDNDGDVRLTVEALADVKIRNELTIARDGQQALAFVRREGPYATAPRPDLILLDLTLPIKDGRQVLVELKNDSELVSIPVVILTGSRSDEDFLRAEQLDVHAYLTKPVDWQQFIALIESMDEFGLIITTLASG